MKAIGKVHMATNHFHLGTKYPMAGKAQLPKDQVTQERPMTKARPLILEISVVILIGL